jgi:hypothetical protein
MQTVRPRTFQIREVSSGEFWFEERVCGESARFEAIGRFLERPYPCVPLTALLVLHAQRRHQNRQLLYYPRM